MAWWDEVAWMVRHGSRPALPRSEWTDEVIDLGADRGAVIQRLLKIYKGLPSPRAAEYLAWLGEATGSGRCPVDEVSAPWMTWDMVRALRDAGMAIGGHSVSHPVLSRTDRAQQEAEIAGCARRIREELGEPMRWFAYPVGGFRTFDAETRALLAANGVNLAFSDYGGYRPYRDWDAFDVRRIAVEVYITGDYFRALTRWPGLMARRRDGGGQRG